MCTSDGVPVCASEWPSTCTSALAATAPACTPALQPKHAHGRQRVRSCVRTNEHMQVRVHQGTDHTDPVHLEELLSEGSIRPRALLLETLCNTRSRLCPEARQRGGPQFERGVSRLKDLGFSLIVTLRHSPDPTSMRASALETLCSQTLCSQTFRS